MSNATTASRWTALSAALLMLSGCGLNGLAALAGPGSDRPVSGPVTIDVDDPVLRWQTFPREEDLPLFGPGAAARITNVSYDLKLWSPTNWYSWAPEPMVVSGLTRPEYRTIGLKAGENYRWAVRATFDLDGHVRVTQWTSNWSPPPLVDKPEHHPILQVVDR